MERASARDLSGIVVIGGVGVASLTTTFLEWHRGWVETADGSVRGRWTGWELRTDFGSTFSWETSSGSYTGFTGWATILAGALLIGLAILLASTIDRGASAGGFELPYPRWVVITARSLSVITLLFMAVTAFPLLTGGTGIGVILFVLAGAGLAAIVFLALPPEDMR